MSCLCKAQQKLLPVHLMADIANVKGVVFCQFFFSLGRYFACVGLNFTLATWESLRLVNSHSYAIVCLIEF